MSYIKRVSRLSEVPGIGVDRMGNLADAAEDRQILRLENLDTDLLPPAQAIDATKKAVGLDENNSYLPFFGQDALRKAATKHVSTTSGIDYDWRSQCIISAGGLAGILNCLLATLEIGDEVILTDPIYAGLINRVRIAGGVPKFVPLIPSENGWRLDLQKLKTSVSPRTKMVLMMSPSMPTGHVLNQEEWAAVVDVCCKANAWLLYNAAMERILYDDRKVIHPASFPDMKDRTITVGSASKELRMIGWRVGWIVGPSSIMNDIGLVSLSNVVSQVGIGMSGVAMALTNSNDEFIDVIKTWQNRRDLLLHELKGLPVIPPHGGWSMLLDTAALGISCTQASEKLFKHAKICATPMIGWGPSAERYIRFVFSNETEQRLAGVGNKIKSALNLPNARSF